MRTRGLGNGCRRHTRVYEWSISEFCPHLAFTTNLYDELAMVVGIPYVSAAYFIVLMEKGFATNDLSQVLAPVLLKRALSGSV
ncbi:MAG: hypothetical protein ABC595_00250 [Candidatus Methanosuratincola petrocarbonis]